MRRFMPFVLVWIVFAVATLFAGVANAYTGPLFAIGIENRDSVDYTNVSVKVNVQSIRSAIGDGFVIKDKDGNEVAYCFEQDEITCNQTPSDYIWVKVPYLGASSWTYLLVFPSDAPGALTDREVFVVSNSFDSAEELDEDFTVVRKNGDTANECLLDGGLLYLTRAVGGRACTIFSKKDVDGPAYIRFRFRVGGGTGADGMAFGFALDSQCVRSGGLLGFCYGYNGYLVELDSYDNGANDDDRYIAVSTTSNFDGGYEKLSPIYETNAVEDDNWHTLEIKIVPNQVSYVALDGTVIIQNVSVDTEDSIPGNILGPNWGIGAGTGGLNNNHILDYLIVRNTTITDPNVVVFDASDQQTLYDTTHYYYLIPFGKVWAEADTFCRDTFGGYLVTVTEASEQDVINNLLSRLPEANHAWIGLNDLASEGNFEWVTGETVSYTNWADGEPNNYYEEDCVNVLYPTGEWNDNGCERHPEYFYICEVGDYYEFEVSPTELTFDEAESQVVTVRTLNSAVTSVDVDNSYFSIEDENCVGVDTGTCTITVRYNGGSVESQTGELQITHAHGTAVVSLTAMQLEPSFSWYDGKDTFASYGDTGKIVIDNPAQVHIEIQENSGAFTFAQTTCDDLNCLIDVEFRPPRINTTYVPDFTFTVPSEGLTYQLTGGNSIVTVSLSFKDGKNAFTKYGEQGAVVVEKSAGLTVELTDSPDVFYFDDTICPETETYCELVFTFRPATATETYPTAFQFVVVETNETLELTGGDSQALVSYSFKDGKDQFTTYDEQGAVVIQNAGYNINVSSLSNAFVLEDTDCSATEDTCELVFYFRPESYSETYTPEFQIYLQETGEYFNLVGEPSSVGLSVSFRDDKKAYAVYNERGAVVIQNSGLLNLTVTTNVPEAFVFDDADCSETSCTCSVESCEFEFVFRPEKANQIYVPSFTVLIENTGESFELVGMNSSATYTAYFVGANYFTDYGQQGTLRVANIGRLTLTVTSNDGAFKFDGGLTASCTDEICELAFTFEPSAVNETHVPSFTVSDAETGQSVTVVGENSTVSFNASIDKTEFSDYGETANLTINKSPSTVVNITVNGDGFTLSQTQCAGGVDTCSITVTFEPDDLNTDYTASIEFGLTNPTQTISGPTLSGRFEFRVEPTSLTFEELHVAKTVRVYGVGVSYTYEVTGPFTVSMTDRGDYHEYSVTATDVGSGVLRFTLSTGQTFDVDLNVNLVYTSSVSTSELVFTQAGDIDSVVVSLTNARITGLEITGADRDYFVLDDRCIGAEEDCRVWIKFEPDALRDYSATLEIQTTAGNHSVSLVGRPTEADAPVPCARGTGESEREVNKAYIIIDMMGNCEK